MNKMHADEIEIDISLVKSLITSQFPQWQDFSIRQIDAIGTDNAIFRLGDTMAVRIPRIKKAAAHIEKEYQWLPKLTSHLPLTIPVPIAKGKRTESYPWQWSIYRWIEGESAVDTISNLSQAAINLGHFVVALRNIDATGGPICHRGKPLQTRDKETRDAIVSWRNVIDIDAAITIWNRSLALPLWGGKSVWIHGDLHADNMLTQNGNINAIIDFGSSGVGDPAVDMMPALTILSSETRQKFREIVNVDDATWGRGRGWALTFGLVAYPYYKNTNPTLAKIARHTIDEVLADK